jgi:hypothetical protein
VTRLHVAHCPSRLIRTRVLLWRFRSSVLPTAQRFLEGPHCTGPNRLTSAIYRSKKPCCPLEHYNCKIIFTHTSTINLLVILQVTQVRTDSCKNVIFVTFWSVVYSRVVHSPIVNSSEWKWWGQVSDQGIPFRTFRKNVLFMLKSMREKSRNDIL